MFELVKKLLYFGMIKIDRGSYRIFGERAVLFWADEFAAVSRRTIEDETFRKEIYKTMRDGFRASVEKLDSKMKLDRDGLIKLMGDFAEMNGYGEMVGIGGEFDNHHMYYRIKGLPTTVLKGKVKGYADVYITGMGAGAGEYIFNDPTIECVEVKCELMGDPYCEFIMAPKERLKKEYPEFYKSQVWDPEGNPGRGN